MVHFGWACSLAILLLTNSLLANEPATAVPEVAWGKIIPGPEGTGLFILEITNWPENGKLSLPTPFANITRAYFADDVERKPLQFEINADSKAIILTLPESRPEASASQIQLETAASTVQYADGRIVFPASDAGINYGDKWIKPPADQVTHEGQQAIELGEEEIAIAGWEYDATRPGMYSVEVTYASNEVPDALIKVSMLRLDRTTNAVPTQPTRNLSAFTTIQVGWFYVPASGSTNFALASKTKSNKSVRMKVKAITLRPACEGKMPEQAEDGTITCHAHDVTIQGVKVQYEPKPEKNTVGYWVNEKDWVYWDFKVNDPGKYQVEILQGCGTGHGGSEVNLIVAGQKLPFIVEDTGHFQNFKPRMIGIVELEAGVQRMSVVPVKKANLAIMDLRQVRLIPVKQDEQKE